MKTVDLGSVALTWAQRAQAELGAEARFNTLSEELGDQGAKANVITMARKAESDEKRHAKMCSEVAKELGHSTGFAFFEGLDPTTSQKVIKGWSNEASPRDQLLCEVTLMCCITETINASLLSSIYGNSANTPEKKIIHEILRDEIKHSQIGWAHLAAEQEGRDCSFLGTHLKQMFEISVKDELFLPVPRETKDEDSFNYGVMPISLRERSNEPIYLNNSS